MPLFKKTDNHAGSGVDKPEPKSLVARVVDKVKAAGQPAPVETPPPKGPAAP